MWRIFITSGIIKARATCSSSLRSAKILNVQVPFSVVNGSRGSSNTTRAKPHEFFDHTGVGGAQDVPLRLWGSIAVDHLEGRPQLIRQGNVQEGVHNARALLLG